LGVSALRLMKNPRLGIRPLAIAGST